MTNLCTRCGNERVFSKSWEETIEVYERKTTIINTEFVCPDPECQKKVEGQIADQKAKRKFSEDLKEKEKQIRTKLRTKNIALARKRS